MNRVAVWAQQIRGPFLVLPVVLVAIGVGAAAPQISYLNAVLTLLGSILAHASVNLFNEYSDYQTQIDSHTRRTPFSGGSGMQQQGFTTPKAVLTASWGTLIAAGAIGFYLAAISTWWLLALMIPGALASVLYTSHLARWGLGEPIAGLTLGSLMVVGAYAVQTGTMPLSIWLVSIPAGILTALLLFLNEFPDAEADKAGGRRHWVIVFGPKNAAYMYVFGLIMVYASTVLAVVFNYAPRGTLLALLTIPFAARAAAAALFHRGDFAKFTQGQALNVVTVLLTDALLAAGFLVHI